MNLHRLPVALAALLCGASLALAAPATPHPSATPHPGTVASPASHAAPVHHQSDKSASGSWKPATTSSGTLNQDHTFEHGDTVHHDTLSHPSTRNAVQRHTNNQHGR